VFSSNNSITANEKSCQDNSVVGSRELWHGKIINIIAQIVQKEVIQVFVKVQWYDVINHPKYPKLNEYYLTNYFDIITPASIRGHCTVIMYDNETYKNLDVYYICNLFNKYYNN